MEQALAETFYCDHGSAGIQETTDKLRDSTDDVTSTVKRTFMFVRDRIPFGFDLYRRKASETLKRGYGACWNKSLLLTALLRRNRIPAYLGTIPLKRSFFAPVIGGLCTFANDPFHHFMVYAFLNERWTLLDTVLDQSTYDTFFKPHGVAWGIDWNGHDDCRLYLESVAGPPRRCEDTDHIIHTRGGNTEFSKLLAIVMNHTVNRKIWKETGGTEARDGQI